MRSPGEIENMKKKIHARARKFFSMGWATLSEEVTMEEEMLEAAARNSAVEKEEQKDERDSSGHVARRSSER